MLAESPLELAPGHGSGAARGADWLALFEELCQVGIDGSLDELLTVVVDTTVSALDGDACSLGLWEAETSEVVIRAHADLRRPIEGARFAPGMGVAGWVASTRRPAVIADAACDPRYLSLEYPRTSSVLSVPLIWDEEFLGTLTVTSTQRNAFDERDLRVLRLFASQASSLVVGARRVASAEARSACLEQALEAAEDGIAVCDADLRLVAINRVAAAALGVSQVEPGTPADSWPRALDGLRPALELAVREGRVTPAVVLPDANGGEPRTVRVSPLLAPDGRAVGAVATIDRTGAAPTAPGWAGPFEDLAHDLTSPLSSLSGILDLVLGEHGAELSEGQRDLLQHAQLAAERLDATIERLVDSPRRGGEPPPALRATSVYEVANGILTRLQVLAEDRGIVLDSGVTDDTPTVNADPFQLARVLENLLENAVKFSRPGGSVRLDANVAGAWLEVAVRDTGIGIPAWALERVFERRYRVLRDGGRDGGTTGDAEAFAGQEGVGLGLHISRRIVEQHGGRIWAESGEGRGTTIRFTLPLAP